MKINQDTNLRVGDPNDKVDEKTSRSTGSDDHTAKLSNETNHDSKRKTTQRVCQICGIDEVHHDVKRCICQMLDKIIDGAKPEEIGQSMCEEDDRKKQTNQEVGKGTREDEEDKAVEETVDWTKKMLKMDPFEGEHEPFHPALKQHKTQQAEKEVVMSEEEAINSWNQEAALSSLMTFNLHHNILQDPNVWIGDSGATCHMTGHICGMVNIKKSFTSATFGNDTCNDAVY